MIECFFCYIISAFVTPLYNFLPGAVTDGVPREMTKAKAPQLPSETLSELNVRGLIEFLFSCVMKY